jgi:sugar phosphate isomerase/epimerase
LRHSRRDFVKAGAATLVAGAALGQSMRALAATTLRLPLGIQLYSVRDLLPKDFAGTLKQVGDLGFREVESAGYYDKSVSEIKIALKNAGLKLVSAHYASDDLHKKLDSILEFNHDLGVEYIICSFPGFKDPARLAKLKGRDIVKAFTLDDWRWNAEQFNTFGDKVKAAGMKFGYHNHTMEFREQDGVVPFAELMRLTDPTKVTIEMDCGWVIVGGGDPIHYLRTYPKRISMLHVKDFKRPAGDTATSGPIKGEPVIEELGRGSIDYAPIFAEAAKGGNIKHCFVEQEGFNVPPMESLKIDADYMRKLGVVS